jgi:response regulator of citrate/malate metabolism
MLKIYTLYYAMNVDSALDMLKNFKPSDVPDLILLDLNFDRQNKQGIDFLKEFNKLQPSHTAGIKVMILTAFAGFKEVKEFETDFLKTEIIQKPFLVQKLLSS